MDLLALLVFMSFIAVWFFIERIIFIKNQSEKIIKIKNN